MTRPQNSNLSASVCQQLDYWYQIKRRDGRGTTELLNTLSNVEDKKIVSVIALMDIDANLLASIVGQEEREFITACHDYLHDRFGPGHTQSEDIFVAEPCKLSDRSETSTGYSASGQLLRDLSKVIS